MLSKKLIEYYVHLACRHYNIRKLIGNNDSNAYKKYHLKSEFVLPQTLSHLFYFV